MLNVAGSAFRASLARVLDLMEPSREDQVEALSLLTFQSATKKAKRFVVRSCGDGVEHMT